MLKALIRPIYFYFLHTKNKIAFSRNVKKQKNNLRLVIGASDICPKDWLPSEQYFLNLLDEKDWQNFFEPNSIKMMLAEHVWEHLTPEDGKRSAAMCFKYLSKGGHLRVAVPDGFHPNPDSIEYVRPGGHGAGADDHKVLYNHHTFGELFESVGFSVERLEYFDEQGQFHSTDWNSEQGHVIRSKRYDKRNKDGQLAYTSLILDVKK
jgi:predicted SAM-dependent methyltransferase